MTREQTFRLVAATLICVGMPVGAYFRLRARRLGAKVTRAQEPPVIRYPLRLCPGVGAGFMLAWLVRPDSVEWATVALPACVRWLGAAMALMGVPLLAWTFRTLGLNLTDTVATRANSFLVTGGPYRFVRHPFYVTVFLFLGGLSVVSALWPTMAAMVLVLVLLALRTPLEEKKLIERFGDAYADYAAKTPRYVPRILRT